MIKNKIFVVNFHISKRTHYDLRLEESGVLKSWAVTKIPQLVKGVKRLAIKVEDHPIEYAKFYGKIPKGNYGAGTVKIWDKGKYNLIKKTNKEYEVDFKGKKLKGRYLLIKTNYAKNSWIFFKA